CGNRIILAASFACPARAQRSPQIRVRFEIRQRNTDDLICRAGDLSGVSDYRGIRIKRALPQAIAENNEGGPVGDVFFRQELTPDHRRHTEDAEKARSHTLLLDVANLVAAAEIQPAIQVAVNSQVDGFRDIAEVLPRGAVLSGLQTALVLKLL